MTNPILTAAREKLTRLDVLECQAAAVREEVKAYLRRHSDEQGLKMPMRLEQFRQEAMRHG